jgi:hypothetical protein
MSHLFLANSHSPSMRMGKRYLPPQHMQTDLDKQISNMLRPSPREAQLNNNKDLIKLSNKKIKLSSNSLLQQISSGKEGPVFHLKDSIDSQTSLKIMIPKKQTFVPEMFKSESNLEKLPGFLKDVLDLSKRREAKGENSSELSLIAQKSSIVFPDISQSHRRQMQSCVHSKYHLPSRMGQLDTKPDEFASRAGSMRLRYSSDKGRHLATPKQPLKLATPLFFGEVQSPNYEKDNSASIIVLKTPSSPLRKDKKYFFGGGHLGTGQKSPPLSSPQISHVYPTLIDEKTEYDRVNEQATAEKRIRDLYNENHKGAKGSLVEKTASEKVKDDIGSRKQRMKKIMKVGSFNLFKKKTINLLFQASSNPHPDQITERSEDTERALNDIYLSMAGARDRYLK